MTRHKTVLLEETIESLKLKEGDAVVDATLGGGGHSLEVLKKILPTGKLICVDRDKNAIEMFKSEVGRRKIDGAEIGKNLILINDNFANIEEILKNENIEKVNAILADFGLSSDQLDDAERGFSFLRGGRLDMRMSFDSENDLTAEKIVNTYAEEKLKEIFQKYGDEKFAGNIAKKIVEKRQEKEIETTKDLAEVINSAVPERYKQGKIHPATKTFQALRIEVNDELRSIERFLSGAVKSLTIGGRLSVITFHSGEDGLVKKVFRKMAKGCECPPEFPVCRCGKRSLIKIVNKKPIVASEKEVNENRRARSAKLRTIEKINF